MLEVLYHHAKFGGLGFHSPPGWPKTLSFCLSVCLSVTLLNVRDCAPDFAVKALEYRKLLGRGRFVVVHSVKLCQTVANWRQH